VRFRKGKLPESVAPSIPPRLCGHIEMHQPAAIMLDHDKDEKNLEEGSRYREEVDGNQLFRRGSSGMSATAAMAASESGPCICL